MAQRLAWVLNFDAELEMADSGGYRPSTRMLARCEHLESQLAPLLEVLFPAEVLVLRRSGARRRGKDPRGAQGIAWASTPSALAVMDEAGVEPLAHPDFETVCRINHRSFLDAAYEPADAEADCLPGQIFCKDMETLDSHLRSSAPDRGWLLKRPFGFAGRSRKKLRGPELTGRARTWAEASMRGYGKGLQVEPLVDIEAELCLHIWIGEGGTYLPGELLLQTVDTMGTFMFARPMTEEDDAGWIEEAMGKALLQLGASAARAGYFGPLGLDGFLWRDDEGRLRLRVASDLNARFSMAWFQGMAKQLVRGQPWLPVG